VAVAKPTPSHPRSAINKITALSLVRNEETSDIQATVAELKEQLGNAGKEIEAFAGTCGEDFKSFERKLMELVWKLGRIAVVLFLTHRQERGEAAGRLSRGGRIFRGAPAQPRNLNTLFGVVRYWRRYMREVTSRGERHGFYPLDEELGLTGDRMSLALMVVAARLALKLSFAEARTTLGMFVPCAPSTEVIEKTVLGLGRHTAAWFESAPAPEEEGEVLVIQIGCGSFGSTKFC